MLSMVVLGRFEPLTFEVRQVKENSGFFMSLDVFSIVWMVWVISVTGTSLVIRTFTPLQFYHSLFQVFFNPLSPGEVRSICIVNLTPAVRRESSNKTEIPASAGQIKLFPLLPFIHFLPAAA